MSEVTPQELVEEITRTVEEATVIPAPVDPTLKIPGEAADAKAVGDALAALLGKLILNGKSPVSNILTLYAGDILMSSAQGAQTIAAAVEAAGDKDASEIMYDAATLTTIKGALDDIYDDLDSELTTEAIDTIFESVFGGGE